MVRCGAVIVGAGKGERLGQPVRKAMVRLGSEPLIIHSTRALARCAAIENIVLVAHPDDHAVLNEEPFARILRECRVSAIVAGGARRQDSVLAGLEALPESIDGVLIHDAARPFVRVSVLDQLCRSLDSSAAAVPVVPMTSTLKRVDSRGRVVETVPRSEIFGAQTPQAVRRDLLIKGLRRALDDGIEVTDDVQAVERLGFEVVAVSDSPGNFKLTTPEDLERAKHLVDEAHSGGSGMRVGLGYDIHRFQAGRPLVLGGVVIPHDQGLLGHSDADAVLHAVADAILGAAALGDIGEHFPDTDPQFKGADSSVLLRHTLDLVHSRGYRVAQIDLNIVTERPKLKNHKAALRDHLALLVSLPPDAVNIKAKTKEGLDAVGENLALEVFCIVVLNRH